MRDSLKAVFWTIPWFLFSIGAGIYIKDYVGLHPLPVVVTLGQAVIGTIGGACIYGVKAIVRRFRDTKNFGALFVNGATHCYGTLLTNAATFYVEVSFAHTVKASDPIFTALLAWMIMKRRENLLTYFSIIITVVGITLASYTEFHFDAMGLFFALLSTALFSMRTVWSKKTLEDTKIDEGELFLIISVITLLAMLISTALMIPFYPNEYYDAFIGNSNYVLLFKIGFCHTVYNYCSYKLLHYVSAISHSILQASKRIVIIGSALLYFRNPISAFNIIASFVAVFGTFLYGYSKRPGPQVRKREEEEEV